MSKKPPCPLNRLPGGCKARVMRIMGEPADRGRLCALGLTPNTCVYVVDNTAGRQLVKVRDCNMVLDDKLSGCIICEYTE